eukprot:gene4203-6549_t
MSDSTHQGGNNDRPSIEASTNDGTRASRNEQTYNEADGFSEDQWEEEYVVAIIEKSSKAAIQPSTSTFKMVGTHTSRPLVQLGNDTFIGQYAEAFGTNLILEENRDENNTDTWKYLGKGTKVLRLEKVELHPRPTSEEASSSVDNGEGSVPT